MKILIYLFLFYLLIYNNKKKIGVKVKRRPWRKRIGWIFGRIKEFTWESGEGPSRRRG